MRTLGKNNAKASREIHLYIQRYRGRRIMFAEFFPRRLFPSRNLRPSFSVFIFFSPSFSPGPKPFLFFVHAHTLSQKREPMYARAFPPLLTAHIPPPHREERGIPPRTLTRNIRQFLNSFLNERTGIQTCAHVDISENRPRPE